MSKLGGSHNFAGGNIEIGSLSLNPASIADNAQGITTGTIEGAEVGDIVFVNPEAMALGVAFVGAKITAEDTVSVYINNESGGAIDLAAMTFDYLLFKRSN